MGSRGHNASKWIFAAAAAGLVTASAASPPAQAAEGDQWRSGQKQTVYEPGLINEKGQVAKQSNFDNGPGGVTLQAGGGLTSFADATSRNSTGIGGFWSVRTVVGLRSVLALEGAYVGSSHVIDDSNMDDGSFLLSHGVEGAVRLNLPLVTGETTIAPFVYGGIGWANYRVVDDQMRTLTGPASDNVLTWPVGAGFAFAYRHFVFDARLSWRFVEQRTLMQTADRDAMALDSWSLGGQVGYVF